MDSEPRYLKAFVQPESLDTISVTAERPTIAAIGSDFGQSAWSTNTSDLLFDTTASLPHNPPVQRAAPKTVTFKLQFDGSSHYPARLPMKVRILPHDSTQSIFTTVRSFYGLHGSLIDGVSFRDSIGHAFVPSYDNFEDDMTVYVRVLQSHSEQSHFKPVATVRSGEAPYILPSRSYMGFFSPRSSTTSLHDFSFTASRQSRGSRPRGSGSLCSLEGRQRSVSPRWMGRQFPR